MLSIALSLSLSHTHKHTFPLCSHAGLAGPVYTATAMWRLQLPSGSLGVFKEVARLPKTSAPTVLQPGYSCYGICFVALPVAINVCMFPAESDPAGGVISLTSTAQMTLHTHRDAQNHRGRRAWSYACAETRSKLVKIYTSTLICCNYRLFIPDRIINSQLEHFVFSCLRVCLCVFVRVCRI